MIKILLVEDNEDDFVLVREALGEKSFQIDWSASAGDARMRLSMSRYDLVLLDHGLPDTNSLSFLDEINQSWIGLPVVVLTGRYDKALAVSAIKKGASSYLVKDEIFTHLRQTVHDALPAEKVTIPLASPESDEATRFVDTAEHIYQLLLEAMSEGCVVVGSDGIISFVNNAIGQLTNAESHLLLGEYLVSYFDEQTGQSIDRILNSPNVSNWTPRSLEGNILRPNQSTVPVLISIYHLEDDSIPYRGDWLLVLTDISQQVEAQQALTRSLRAEQIQRSRLDALIESSRDGIILVGDDLNVSVINGMALEILNLNGERDAWIGRSFAALSQTGVQSSESFASILQQELRRLNKGDTTPGSGSLTTAARLIDWQSLPVQQDGLTYGQMFILQDVTEQKHLESMREMLTNTMVHDLRSPLATIHSSLEYVLELAGDQLSSANQQMLEVAFRSSRTMLDLVSNILEVSRLESGEMPVNCIAIPVDYLLYTAAEQIAPQAAAKSIEINTEVPTGLPPAFTDQMLVDRVLQNLLDNAVKFSPPESTINVTLRQQQADAEAGYIAVDICDAGVGIPAGAPDQIFQKFTTGDNEHSGTGLGLAFCKLAIETLGGQISAYNLPAGGACFTFTLPVAGPAH